jgi:hypothetical protein
MLTLSMILIAILHYIHCMMFLLHLNNMLLMSQKKSSSLVLCEAVAGKPPAKWPPEPPLTKRAQERHDSRYLAPIDPGGVVSVFSFRLQSVP